MEFRKSLLCFATIATLSPTLAMAEQPSYNFFDGGYLRLDLDDLDLDPTGFFARGSVEISDNWFLHGGLQSADDSTGVVDVDADQFNLGAGFKTDLGTNTSLHVVLDYINVEVEAANRFGGRASVDENGYGLGVGVRSMASENFELNADVGYSDLGDEDGLGFGVGAVWYVTESLGLLVELSSDDDSNNQFMIGGRLNF